MQYVKQCHLAVRIQFLYMDNVFVALMLDNLILSADLADITSENNRQE